MLVSNLQVLIVDDEPGARKVIKGFLGHSYPNISQVDEASGVMHAKKQLESKRYDLMFLDIEMEDGTGFDLLDQLDQVDFPVIFTTAHDDFAIKAFRYNAVDYLLKPIDPDEFTRAVDKAIQYSDLNIFQQQFQQLLNTTKEKNFDRITLSTSDGLVFAYTKDITRIETYGNYSFVFMAEGDRLLVSRNLKEFEEMLPEPDFFRVHQSHIVNTAFVKKFIKGEGDHVVMTDGQTIPVSRRKKDDFMKILRSDQ